MCPDRHIISLYFDGELPSPWKEKMAAHLDSCPKCQAVLAGYRNLGESLEELRDETIEAAQDRVWKKITAPEIATGGARREGAGKTASRRLGAVKRVWNRSITLPLPAAAAAAVLIIFVAFFAFIGTRGGTQSMPQTPMAAMSIGFDDYAMIPIHDMNDVLRYLSIQDNMDFMVVRLPENRRFSRSGEPTLINAVDYSRTRRTFPR